MFSARTCLSFFCACFAGYRNQKTIDEIKSDYVKIYEYLFPKLLKKRRPGSLLLAGSFLVIHRLLRQMEGTSLLRKAFLCAGASFL